MFRLFTTIVFIATLSSSYGQVTLVPTNTQSSLWPISVIGNNIVVGGVNNFLVKSYDECNTLIPLTVPGPSHYWNYLDRLDTNLSYILSQHFGSYNNKIFKSTDGCQSWNKKLDSSGLLLTHLKFFNSMEGIALSTFNKLLRTTDGGNTWVSGSHPLTVASCIKTFGDSIVGIGGSLGNFSFSKDRGMSWYGGGNFGSQAGPTDIFFINKDTIFVIGSLGIYEKNFGRSYNGGINWTYSKIAPGYTVPNALHAKSSKEIYVAGATSGSIGVILKTIDEGQSWSIFSTNIKTQLTDIKFLNDSIALLAGSDGVLLKWNSKTAIFSPITGINDYPGATLSLTIYPNPVEDKLNIEPSNDLTGKFEINIVNTLGQIIYSKNNVELKNEIDVSFLSSGVYYLNISNETGIKNFKIVKK